MAQDRKSPKLVEARTLKGFRDTLPAEAILKGRMLATARAVFESFGYAPIETPHLEYTETLIGQTEGEIEKQLYRFEDNGGRDVSLRFDLTVPFARFVVQHRDELGIPFKRYAIGNVFRGEQPQFGRYREFTQCDFDIVGTESIAADAEIIEVVTSCLTKLGIKNFIVGVNTRRLMNAFSESLGLGDKIPSILRAIDKLRKIGPAEVTKELQSEAGISGDTAKQLLEFVSLSDGATADAIFERLKEYEAKFPALTPGIQELKSVHAILSSVESAKDSVKIDLSIARGLGYYTGVVFETFLSDLPEIGSVCSGGRYDDLTLTYSKEKLSGVGGSIGLDRLLAALEKLKLFESSGTPAKLLIAVMQEDDFPQIRNVAEKLRAEGIGVEVYPEAAKLKKQFQYADRKGHAYVAVLGPDELRDGKFTVKDLKSGDQKTYASLSQAVSVLKASL